MRSGQRVEESLRSVAARNLPPPPHAGAGALDRGPSLPALRIVHVVSPPLTLASERCFDSKARDIGGLRPSRLGDGLLVFGLAGRFQQPGRRATQRACTNCAAEGGRGDAGNLSGVESGACAVYQRYSQSILL